MARENVPLRKIAEFKNEHVTFMIAELLNKPGHFGIMGLEKGVIAKRVVLTGEREQMLMFLERAVSEIRGH